FQKNGLKPAGVDGTYFQPFTITGGSKLGENNRVTLNGPRGQKIDLEMGKQFNVFPLGGSGKITAPVVFAGYGITADDIKYDDFKGVDVAGKVVIIVRRTPQQENSHVGNFSGDRYSRHAPFVAKGTNADLHKPAGVSVGSDRV